MGGRLCPAYAMIAYEERTESFREGQNSSALPSTLLSIELNNREPDGPTLRGLKAKTGQIRSDFVDRNSHN